MRTPDAREYLDLTCLESNEVSFSAGESHWAIGLFAGVLGFVAGIGPIPRDYGDNPHLSVIFVTKRLQTVCYLIREHSTSSASLNLLLSVTGRGCGSHAAGTSPFARTVLQSGHFHRRKLHLSGKNSLRNIGDLSLSHRTCGPGSGRPQFPLAS